MMHVTLEQTVSIVSQFLGTLKTKQYQEQTQGRRLGTKRSAQLCTVPGNNQLCSVTVETNSDSRRPNIKTTTKKKKQVPMNGLKLLHAVTQSDICSCFLFIQHVPIERSLFH